ncbi:MAG: glycosyltransferase family A protein, partial [Desulfuromonadaceae bacterium]|nr:glycosyltransferase family A protein [Desulfuromonadaceae bacterium]
MPDTAIPPNITAYLKKRGAGSLWVIEGLSSRTFSGAVVIPSLAESATLPETLESLSHNPPELLERFLILVVVNQRTDASVEEKRDNMFTLSKLPFWKELYRLHNLSWVDAASVGKELRVGDGVGLARKIGLDLSLKFLDYGQRDPILICLDSDTLVQPNYLPSLSAHFSSSSAGGGIIPYCHRKADEPAGQSAIDRYELFLRAYVLGLQIAGSPYAFHTVGSAMACRASVYVSSGGMNRRLAGEDFYFLQQVFKTSGIEEVRGTLVSPSPRSSNRVPFGTGRSVGDMLKDGESRLMFYHPSVYSIVGDWIECAKKNIEEDASS